MSRPPQRASSSSAINDRALVGGLSCITSGYSYSAYSSRRTSPVHSRNSSSTRLNASASARTTTTTRKRANSHEAPVSRSAKFLFTPVKSTTSLYSSRYKQLANHNILERSTSNTQLDPPPEHLFGAPPPYSADEDADEMESESEADEEPLTMRQGITHRSSRTAVAGNGNGVNGKVKMITTAKGEVGAGETETEIDEPSRHLPTNRIRPSSGPIIPPNTLEQRLTPLLFELARLLSIVPALLGMLWCTISIYNPPSTTTTYTRPPPTQIDFALAFLWALLTAHQSLAMTTGLLRRWSLYYSPLSTLIRLFALQGICWPLTQLTLTVVGGGMRPVSAWAVIGTSTSVSRSVQIWVTSNLWWSRNAIGGQTHEGQGYWRRVVGGGTWGGRRWDWKEVGLRCMLPAGMLYFVMAWVGEGRREWGC